MFKRLAPLSVALLGVAVSSKKILSNENDSSFVNSNRFFPSHFQSNVICESKCINSTETCSTISDLRIDSAKFFEAFRTEIYRCLRAKGMVGDLKMLDSFVSRVPTGKESGSYYAIDFGGTNLRIAKIKFSDGEVDIQQRRYPLNKIGNYPRGMLDKLMPYSELFAHLADTVIDTLKHYGDDISDSNVKIGFTFSFPSNQTAINRASLVCWTKEFETGRATSEPVEGEDVGFHLQQALKAKGCHAKIIAVVNDTVGTLVSGAFALGEKDAAKVQIAYILGTGANACYVEPDARSHGYLGKIINMECGNFHMESRGLRCEVDRLLDNWLLQNTETDINKQQMERMISGKYLGELSRLLYLSACAELKIEPKESWLKPWSVPSELACEKFSQVEAGSSNCLFARACHAVVCRSAELAAVSIAAMSHHMDDENAKSAVFSSSSAQNYNVSRVCVIDGSLYVENADYRRIVRHRLDQMGYQKLKVEIAKDGSGVGAALIAALH